MQAYSQDLRERLLRALDREVSVDERFRRLSTAAMYQADLMELYRLSAGAARRGERSPDHFRGYCSDGAASR